MRAVTELTATVTLFYIRYTLRGTGTVTNLVVASYLAKYSTKGTEITGHASARITPGSPPTRSTCTSTPQAAARTRTHLPSGSGRT